MAFVNVDDSEAAMMPIPDFDEEGQGLSRETRVPPKSAPAWHGMAVRGAAAIGFVAVGYLLGSNHPAPAESIVLPGLLKGTEDSKAALPNLLGLNELEVSSDFPDQVREMMHPLLERKLLPGRVRDGTFGDTDKVDCSIDVTQTVFRLMEAANAIVQAVDFDCKKHGGAKGLATFGDAGNDWTNDDRLRCSSSILTSIYSFVITATMIASAVSDCVPGYDPSGQCTAAITSFSGNMLVAVQSGIGSDLACAPSKEAKLEWAKRWGAGSNGNWDENKHPVLHNINKAHSNLLPADPLANFSSRNDRAIPRCIAFVGLGSTFVMRMATGITASVTQCSQEKIKSEASGSRLCAVDMMGLIGSLSLAASFLSGAVDACGLIEGDGDREAGCAASITGIVGGLSAALAADGQLIGVCSRAELSATQAVPEATLANERVDTGF